MVVPAQVLTAVFSTLFSDIEVAREDREVTPVPPLFTAIVVPSHTPVAIVPSLVITGVIAAPASSVPPSQVVNLIFSSLSIAHRILTAAGVAPPVPPWATVIGTVKEFIVPLLILILSASIAILLNLSFEGTPAPSYTI